MEKKIKPKFNKNMPKNAKHYFNPASDDVFKAEHPNIYKILVACGITALMLPVFIYMAFILFIYPAPNSGWMLLGFAGAFIIGIGLFNIVAAWIGQYLGHLVSIICFAVGALMVLSSILLLYNHTLYDLFDQEMVTYYFINMLFMSLPIIFYVVFRSEIYNWLRARRISKSTIRKGEKGIKNFWWYEGINEKQNMGLLYYINRLFTIIYPVMFITHFLFGFIKVISIPVSGLLILTCILTSMMNVFSTFQTNKEVHGKPIVLVARSENGGIDSFIFDIFEILFPLGVAYTELIIILNLWQLPWNLSIK